MFSAPDAARSIFDTAPSASDPARSTAVPMSFADAATLSKSSATPDASESTRTSSSIGDATSVRLLFDQL